MASGLPEEFLKNLSQATSGPISGTLQGLFGPSSGAHFYAEHMLDAIFVGLSFLFFIVGIGYVAVCDRLMK